MIFNKKGTVNRELLTGRNDMFPVKSKKNSGFKSPHQEATPTPQALGGRRWLGFKAPTIRIGRARKA